jgi:hypothetical protein
MGPKNMKKLHITSVFLGLFCLILANFAFSAESFVLGTYNPQIDICKDEIFDDSIYIYNNGNYLSDFKFILETKDLSDFAKISGVTFSLYPGQAINKTLRFQIPQDTKTGQYIYEISLITALQNKKTIRYIVNVKDCPLNDFIEIEKEFELNACQSYSIPIKLKNNKNENISYEATSELPFAEFTKKVKIEKNSTYDYNFTFFVPCNEVGEKELIINLTAAQIIRNTKSKVNIIPHPYHVLSTPNENYAICENEKAIIPLTIENTDKDLGHTINISLNKEVFFIIKSSANSVELSKKGTNESKKTIELTVNPVLIPINTNLTITAEDEKGAKLQKTYNLNFLKQSICESFNLNVLTNEIIAEPNLPQDIRISLEYKDLDLYNQKDFVEYELSIEPSQSWITLSQNKINVSKGNTKIAYLNIYPKNYTVSREYDLSLVVKSKNSKDKRQILITVPKHDGEDILSNDNLSYMFSKYFPYAIMGILLGIILIIIIALRYQQKPKYRIIKKGEVKKEKEHEEKKSYILPSAVASQTISAKKIDETIKREEKENLLQVIEVEKKAREKIIKELEDWSNQYEFLQKERQEKDIRHLKSKEQIEKEYKDISELLNIQKQSYENLKKREKEIKKNVKPKKESRFKLFGNNKDYLSMDEIKKRGNEENIERITKRVKKTSKKTTKTIGQKIKSFFVEDEENKK